MPCDYYLYWQRFKKCKTWGEMKKVCKGYYDSERLLQKYEMKCDQMKYYTCHYPEDTMYRMDKLMDDTNLSLDIFDLSEHSYYGDDTSMGMFPPCIEIVMYDALARDEERYMLFVPL